jgi:hypothetical protein
MGFDDGECYICSSDLTERFDICFECLSKIFESRDKSVSSRWYSAFSQSILENGMGDEECIICGYVKRLTVNLSLCEKCILKY